MEFKVRQHFDVIPSDEPKHSHIEVYNSLQPDRKVRYEYVPDVLVDEFIHEMKESAKAAMEAAFDHIKGAGNQ